MKFKIYWFLRQKKEERTFGTMQSTGIVLEVEALFNMFHNLMKGTLELETNKDIFLIESNFDVLASPANLVLWNKRTTAEFKFGKKAMVRHFRLALSLDGYAWSHNEVLSVINVALNEKIEIYNKKEYSKGKSVEKIYFQKEGKGQRHSFQRRYSRQTKDGRDTVSWLSNGKTVNINTHKNDKNIGLVLLENSTENCNFACDDSEMGREHRERRAKEEYWYERLIEKCRK